jgi:hypothetical protein
LISLPRSLVAVLAVFAIGCGLWRLHAATDGLIVEHIRVGPIPVTMFRPATGPAAPVVVIAHGFAGSQQLMQPFAVTLARNGYTAVTFDLPGHGQNPSPMPGGLADDAARNQALIDALTSVVAFARTLPSGDAHLALLGHSMATDIVVRVAEAVPGIDATVAVSLFSPAVTATQPRNLLVIDGALEPAMVRDEGARAVGLATGGTVEQRVTYGSFADGTARRLTLAGGVEHIGVLYSAHSQTEALDWFNQVFERSGSGYIDTRGPWLGLLYLGLIALAWPLAGLLPVVAQLPAGAGGGWGRLLLLGSLPAILTPLLLWKLPTDFLPILLGDYLAVHFAVYGLLTAIGLALTRPRSAIFSARVSSGKLAIAAAVVAAYAILAVGTPIDLFVTSFWPTASQVPLIMAMLAGTLPYFIADEWLTRGPGAARGGYAVTKLFFLLSLAMAVALNLPRLFFLIIIIPVILIFLVVYGLFATWAYRRTRHPLVGALANALAFAWAIAVTFPIMG